MFLLYFFVSKLNGWNDGWICIVTQEAVPQFFCPSSSLSPVSPSKKWWLATCRLVWHTVWYRGNIVWRRKKIKYAYNEANSLVR